MGGVLSPAYRMMRRLVWPVALVMVATLAAEVGGQQPAAAKWRPPVPQAVTGVKTVPMATKLRPSWTNKRAVPGKVAVSWPAAGTATVDLPAPTAAKSGAAAFGKPMRASGLPVTVAALPATAGVRRAGSMVRRAQVRVLDRSAAAKAGVSGLVFEVGRADGVAQAGPVSVTVDYSGFAKAYGGDWANRLQLVTLPGGERLPTVNNTRTSTLTATVDLTAAQTVTLAAAAAATGDTGDYQATSLSPASTWQVSAQTGDFTWSYPVGVPPAVGGPQPRLALSYSSGSIDGRTAGTNNQGSWIGDGWDLWPGFIERSYRSCADDKDAVGGNDPNNRDLNVYDQCWFTDNATISFNGSATELVKDGAGLWHGVSDDGSRIEQLTDSGLGNGDEYGQFWKVTTVDGTQYFFGRGHGVGGATAGTATQSVWTVPVYSNHPGETGHAAAFADSMVTRAWRWNLDYVVDPHGNNMTYFYGQETGAYGREADPAKRTTYVRGGWLSRIAYGSRADASASTQPAGQVLFDVADRCASGCYDTGGKPVPAQWVDTPWDQYCQAAPCTDQLAPTFWTGKRLAAIRTQVYSGAGTTFSDVNTVSLRHTYLQAGGNSGNPMWLAGITKTGTATAGIGANVSDPEIVFDPGADPLKNRVDGPADGRSDLYRYRINTVTTESGAQIAVTYSPPQCTSTALPSAPTNSQRCFPQWYAPAGEEPTLDWFHKYVVTRVDVDGNLGGSTTMQTNYDYLDSPAWHYDDSELVPAKKRTWAQWRGYSKVRVRSGLTSGTQSATEYLYFRGMDGDKQTSGTRSVSITDSQGTSLADHEAYQGMLREQTILNGAGGTWLAGTISTPWLRGPTATSGSLKAWMTDSGTVRSRTLLSSGATRWAKTVTTFNDDGLPTQVDDLADESTAADDLCTRAWYARNGTNWMLDKVKRTETVGVNCSTTATLPADMVSSSRITYDAAGNDWDTYLPVKGDPVKTEEIDSWTGTTPNWIPTAGVRYDANGRVTEVSDALGRTTTTTYTPDAAGPLTQTVMKNPLGQSVTNTLAAAWGVPVTTVDANGATASVAYDRMGRLRRVWKAAWSPTDHPNDPDLEFEYLIRKNAPVAVTTTTLLPWGSVGKTKSVTLYDGLMRPRQVQTAAPGGGRTIVDTVYDSRGLVDWTSNPYYDTTNAPVDTTLRTTTGNAEIPSLVQNLYDGAGRLTDAIFEKAGVEAWRTHNWYGGNRTSVTPPSGGMPTEILQDARGRTTELRQYTSRGGTTYDKTAYTYTDRGDVATMTDAANNVWRYAYDQRGHKISDQDPDKGDSADDTTRYAYDRAGQLTSSTDVRGVSLFYAYDNLGRRTSVREGSATGSLRAKWDYDTLTNGIGKLTRSIRYEPAGSTNAYTNEVTGYDTAGRPTGTTLTIPSTQGALCASKATNTCSYAYGYTYWFDGTLARTTRPAAADLASERTTQSYGDVGQPDGLYSAAAVYVNTVAYHKLGGISQRVLGQTGARVWLNYNYEDSTGRMVNAGAIPELKSDIFYYTYKYDNAGNLIRIADTPNGGQTADTQCFSLDYLTRLSEAWTPSSGNCDTAPTVAGLGGAAPYWHSYTYDVTGNRKTETVHAATNTVRTYAYPASGGGTGTHPHAVSTVTETTGTASKTFTYGYDLAGNTLCRPTGTTANTCAAGNTAKQTLTWNNENRVATSVDSTGTTSYLYDADGNRLIRTDPGGKTLYLPDGTEVRAPTTGTATGTRYYAHAGTPVAVRAAGKLTWLLNDHHNTGEATVDSTTLTVTRRRTTPFGNIRGTKPSTWAGDKGFVGGTTDNTGLTHLGAREYDPTTGRFTSLDPLQDLTDPQQWNGYAYANNSPVTSSDPSGLIVDRDRPGCAPGNGGNCGGYVRPDKPAQPRKQDPVEIKVDGYGQGSVGGVTVTTDQVKDVYGYGTQVNEAYFYFRDNVTNWAALDDSLQLLKMMDWACQQLEHNQCTPIYANAVHDALAANLVRANGGDPAYGAMVRAGANEEGGGANAAAVGGILARNRTSLRSYSMLDEMAEGIGHACVRANSFRPDTRVLLADGTTKLIAEIHVGDEVLATDPTTGATRAEKVTALHVNTDTELVDLTVKSKTGVSAIVHTTAHHPFWSQERQKWIDAAGLAVHEKLTAPMPLAGPAVSAVRSFDGSEVMYNLTVANIHTYYVLAGTTPVLVHNVGEGCVVNQTLGAGEHAREGVALVDGDINAPGVRGMVNEAGDAHGCHVCGSTNPGTRTGNWVPDHQPPTTAVAPGTPQTAYPHCLPCARQQGGIVRQLNEGNYDFP